MFDFFPDTSAYPSECLFDTGFEFANGTTAKLYDNTCAGVVDLHFKWMQQYGIDGVFVQRFYGALSDATFLTVSIPNFNRSINFTGTDGSTTLGFGPCTSFC